MPLKKKLCKCKRVEVIIPGWATKGALPVEGAPPKAQPPLGEAIAMTNSAESSTSELNCTLLVTRVGEGGCWNSQLGLEYVEKKNWHCNSQVNSKLPSLKIFPNPLPSPKLFGDSLH